MMTLPQPSPMVAQQEFAFRLRRQRERAGLGAAEVARHLKFSRNFYSAVENCRAFLSPRKLATLTECLGFDEDESHLLADLLARSKQKGWWHEYAPLLDDAFARYVGLECAASAITAYEARIFPGLLQTEAYARHVMDAAPGISTLDLDRTLEARMRRQRELFRRQPPPQMTFVFSEAVIMQQYGGPEVLKEQLRHVLHLADDLGDRFDLRIQTFGATPHGLGAASTVVLLDFDTDFVPSCVYREAGLPLGVSDDQTLVRTLQLHFQQALSSSATRSDSIALLRERVNQLG